MSSKRHPQHTAIKRNVRGQLSWRLASDQVEAFVTETGGHLGPVTFDRRGRKWQPYSVAPWAEEDIRPPLLPILKVLRGDFFCLPFGGNGTKFQGEQHPVHGDTANARWRLESLGRGGDATTLHLSLETRVRPGRVDKSISLLDGQNAIYSEHVVSGMQGPMNAGHHAMLKFPEEPGSGLVSTSRFVYGQVLPGAFELPENGGYSSLKPGAQFKSLDQVPLATGGNADLSQYPARRGFEDLVLLASDADAPFAWTAVAFPKQRYVWFALKDPRVLRSTVFWLSNGGRHYPPWSSRHVGVMGLEEVTAYFHLGLAESARQNALSRKGIATCFRMSSDKPLSIRYIMGVASVPAGFSRVVSIEPDSKSRAITLRAANGKQARAPVCLDFLTSGICTAG